MTNNFPKDLRKWLKETNETENLINHICKILRCKPANMIGKLETKQKQIKELEEKLVKLKKEKENETNNSK